MVGMEGVEPPRLTALEPKSSVSASSTTSPVDCLFYMTKARIKPKTAKISHIIALKIARKYKEAHRASVK